MLPQQPKKIKMFMKQNLVFLLFMLMMANVQAQRWYDVTVYGAKKDSSAKATAAIAKAIAAASKAGGGTVYFPAGKYLTGAIHLVSNITVFIDAGAEIHFSDDFDDYLPLVESRFEGVDVKSFSPLFYAYRAENISITGRGTVNGHGKKWWDFAEGYKDGQPRSKWQLLFDSLNKKILLPDDAHLMQRGFLRPPFIQFMYCKNVLVEGITLTQSPFWTVNPEFCENVTVTGVTINNPKSPNTDGINPESCKYVHISNCHISVGDDCITIKSGKDVPGRAKAAAAEDYTISNCTMLNGHGGVVIGSEMSGDVRKIVISNCIFDGTDRGIRIKTARGRGGVVEDIRVDNIVMKNIKEQAIVLDMEYSKMKPEPVSERTPQFRNIRFSHITATTRQAIYINGLDEMPVQETSFQDMVFEAAEGISIRNAKDIALRQVRIVSKTGPAVQAERCTRLEIDGLESAKPIPDMPLIQLSNTQQAWVHNCWPFAGTVLFAAIKGAETKNIRFGYNNLATALIDVGEEVKKEEVSQ